MKNEFDKKLADKGWQFMRRALDREMPEQHRRRPFVWWWLAALLLLPLAGGGGWWLYHRQAKPATEVPKPEAAPPTTRQPIAGTTNKNSSDAPASAREEVNSRQHSEHFPPKAFGIKTATTPSQSTSQMADPAFALVPVYPPLGQQDAADLENPLREPQTADFSKIELFAALPIPPKFVEKETRSAPSLFTVVPLAAATTKKHAPPTRWSFGLSAGLASEKLSAVNGFSAGLATNWQFARKWGLRSGLQYAQSRLSENKRPVVSLDDDTYVLATGNFEVMSDFNPPTGTPASTQAPTVFVPIEKLRQMEMPLMAYWQPTRSLRIFGGASVGYNLSAQASPESFANNTSYFADTQEAKNNLNDLAANNLPRWQMSLQTGIGIRIGQHFELDAFYKHGIKGGNKNADTSAEMLADLQGLQLRGIGSSHYFLLSGTWFF